MTFYTLIHPNSSLFTPTHSYSSLLFPIPHLPSFSPIPSHTHLYTLFTLIPPTQRYPIIHPHSTLSPPIHPNSPLFIPTHPYPSHSPYSPLSHNSPPFTPTHPNSPVFTTHHQVVGMILDNGATPDLTMVPLLTTWLSTGIKGLFRGRTCVCVRACMSVCVHACMWLPACVCSCMHT